MKIKKLAALAVLLAVSMILSYLESLLFVYPIPGMKIGLTNLVTVFILYRMGFKEALLLGLLRIALLSLLFGNIASFFYSLGGFSVSIIGMGLLKRIPILKPFTVSAVGGMLHNITQLLVAWILLQSKGVWAFLPSLLAIGLLSGLIIGIVGTILIKRIPGGNFAEEKIAN